VQRVPVSDNHPMTRRSLMTAGIGSVSAQLLTGFQQELQLSRVASLNEFEALAKARLPAMAFDFVAGGVGNEITLRANVNAWDTIRLRPRVLTDVSRIDTRVNLLGSELPQPLLLAPTSYHRLCHPDGELATVKGASQSNTTMVISSFANTRVEDIAAAAPARLWYQLYVPRDRGFAKEMVERAVSAGCKALCLTVDMPARGYRDRDIRNSFALPYGLDRPNYRGLSTTTAVPLGDVYHVTQDPTFQWRDLEWLRGVAKVPVVAKGIMTPEDAELAVKAGVAAVLVSNHGGRSVDTLPATADVLEGIAQRVAGRVPVLVDGGIRRGTDVVKALALGAAAVLIGRPYLYALATAGAVGVERIVNILTLELKMAMAVLGRTTISSIDRSVLWRGDARG
jgi:4-hydroxymandelate oxidase